MYRHLLIATDGSELAEKAVAQGLALAKELGAKVTALTVTEPFASMIAGEAVYPTLIVEYDKAIESSAKNILAPVSTAAGKRRRDLRDCTREGSVPGRRDHGDRQSKRMRPDCHGFSRPARRGQASHGQSSGQSNGLQPNSRTRLPIARRQSISSTAPQRKSWASNICPT